jgi:hypothetical protein
MMAAYDLHFLYSGFLFIFYKSKNSHSDFLSILYRKKLDMKFLFETKREKVAKGSYIQLEQSKLSKEKDGNMVCT